MLGEMDKTIACDISVARAELGYDPRSRSRRGCGAASAGASSRASSCDDQPRHRRQRLLRPAARATPRRRAATTCGCSTSTSPAPIGRGVEVIAARHPRRRPPCARAVDGVDVVYHNVAQVPLAQDPHLLRSVNVDGTQILLDACADAGVAKVVHTSSSAVFGVPESNPVLPTTVPKPAGGLRPRQAGRRVGVPARRRRAASTSPSCGRARSSATAASASSGSCSTGSPTAPTRSCSATARTATSSSTPTTWPTVCLLAADARRAGRVQRRHRPLRHDARGARAPLRPRRHRRRGALACRPARRRRRCGPAPPLRLTPFAPYHWLMYARSMWFDIDHVRDALGWTPRWSTDEMFAESYDWFFANRADGRRRVRRTTAARPGPAPSPRSSGSPASCPGSR